MVERRRAMVGIVLVMLLIVIGVVTWAVMRVPAPRPAAAGVVTGEKRIFGPGAPWMLLVGAVPGDERAVTVSVSARDREGRPIASPAPPLAVLRMVDIPTLPERLVLVEEAPGSWRGAARLSTAGRWKLEIELDGETVSLPFQSGSLPKPVPEAGPGGHPSHAGDPAAFTDGVVLSVDRSTGNLTISHGPMPKLGMPAMTMGFRAGDPALLEGLRPGGKVRFHAHVVDGTFTVAKIEPVN